MNVFSYYNQPLLTEGLFSCQQACTALHVPSSFVRCFVCALLDEFMFCLIIENLRPSHANAVYEKCFIEKKWDWSCYANIQNNNREA